MLIDDDRRGSYGERIRKFTTAVALKMRTHGETVTRVDVYHDDDCTGPADPDACRCEPDIVVSGSDRDGELVRYRFLADGERWWS